jgi:hypothetical protein
MVVIAVPVGVALAALFLQWVEARLDWSLAPRPSRVTRTGGYEVTPATFGSSCRELPIASSARHI